MTSLHGWRPCGDVPTDGGWWPWQHPWSHCNMACWPNTMMMMYSLAKSHLFMLGNIILGMSASNTMICFDEQLAAMSALSTFFEIFLATLAEVNHLWSAAQPATNPDSFLPWRISYWQFWLGACWTASKSAIADMYLLLVRMALWTVKNC